ncbi:DUF1467 domain-containing protein [Natronosalvus rutilus]|uniref:DUF1467 domain-containing protein n=1 Tax=Natronosalvus rutilus TaxID=2953753 RepID=A0A9E7NBW4_9EURY|nr:DUF1467 domain-containing protein [Natronosalvus rutilus]UTF54128.1 DUF1467 domain-containing protein [Natronosalvus rutilus]
MPTRLLESTRFVTVMSATLVAAGVAISSGLTPSVRSLAALCLVSVGLAGVAIEVSERPLEGVHRAAVRWWAVAFVAFLPYGLVAAPSSEGATAVANSLSGTIPLVAFEVGAGSAFLCAIAVTTLYAMARYGVHPGRPRPEERILAEGDD